MVRSFLAAGAKELASYPSGKGKLVSIPSNIDQFKFSVSSPCGQILIYLAWLDLII